MRDGGVHHVAPAAAARPMSLDVEASAAQAALERRVGILGPDREAAARC